MRRGRAKSCGAGGGKGGYIGRVCARLICGVAAGAEWRAFEGAICPATAVIKARSLR